MRTKITDLALAEVGTAEGSKKHHQYIDDYNTIYPLPYGYRMTYTVSWCMAFMTWLFLKSGLLQLISGGECSCGRMINLAIANGTWVEDNAYKPSPGDLIMYDWDNKDGWPEHVGMVVSVSGNTFKVVEGNKSDAVGTRTMSINGKYIRGFVVPKYDEDSTDNTNKEDTVFKIAEDSRFGCETTSAAQRLFGCKIIDGIVSNQTTWCKENCHPECSPAAWEWDNEDGGSNLIKQIQTFLNIEMFSELVIDGLCGPKTISALQEFLNVTISGIMDADTVLAFQKYLNSQLEV